MSSACVCISNIFRSIKIEVDSLQIIITRYILSNLTKFPFETLTCLPPSVKNLLLKKFLCSQYSNQNEDLYDYLSVLVNSTTTEIDLTCLEIDHRILLDVFKNCHSLRKLYMRNPPMPKLFPHTLRGRPSASALRKIRSRKPSQFTSTGLSNMLKNVPNLECLVLLENWESVDNTVLKSLSDHCPKLYGLDIRGCINVSDEGMNYLSQLGIKWLKLSQAKITDKGLSILGQGKCAKTLEEFQISKCSGVTKVGLMHLSKSCHKLTVLHCDTEQAAEVIPFSQQVKQFFWDIPM